MYSLEYVDFKDIKFEWDIAFIGTHNDERDIATKSFLTTKTKMQHTVEYNLDELCLTIDTTNIQIHKLKAWLKKFRGHKIIIDATSMTVAELYVISKQLYLLNIVNFEVIYVEPIDYSKSESDAFMLSDYGIGFASSGVPSLTAPFNDEEKKHVIFLLGYEGDRFADAMEKMQLKAEQTSLIFGVPSYKLNWEKNAYAANLKVIVDNELNDKFIFCGANNPAAVAREVAKLQKLHSSSQLFIVPIGTKPQAIGCLPTICIPNNGNNTTGLCWDHPKRKHGRTKGISKIQVVKEIFA